MAVSRRNCEIKSEKGEWKAKGRDVCRSFAERKSREGSRDIEIASFFSETLFFPGEISF